MQIQKLTPELLQEVKNRNKDHAERITEAEALAEEVRKVTSYEVTCDHYFSESYYEHSRIFVPFNHIIIEIKKDWKKKYEISCPTIYKLIDINYLSHGELNKIEQQHTKPNNIGKLTEKKFDDWVTYYNKIYFLSIEKLKEIKIKAQTFRDEVNNSGLSVNWSNEHEGEIIKNGLIFKFTIVNGKPQSRIEFHYKVNNDFQTFLQLSDNKYNVKI